MRKECVMRVFERASRDAVVSHCGLELLARSKRGGKPLFVRSTDGTAVNSVFYSDCWGTRASKSVGIGSDQLRRFYSALWNIAFLSDSNIFGRFLFQKTSVKDLLPQEQYPAHVVRFMKRNPTIKRWSKNVHSSDSVSVRALCRFDLHS